MTNICVVGTGYVGLVTGTCLAEMGHTVWCVDINEDKINRLNRGETPIYEAGLDELLHRNQGVKRLFFSNQLSVGLAQAEVVFLAINTPSSESGDADLSYLSAAVDTIVTHCDTHLGALRFLVIKSTVPVGTGAKIQQRLLPYGISVISNPEFLREGQAVQDALYPNRIVVGVNHVDAEKMMRRLYHGYVCRGVPLVVTTVPTSELIKYAANSFLATKISFINEIAMLCEAVGADVLDVAHAIGLDQRIGPHFLSPGPGFGGSCFPKDIQALQYTAKEKGVDLHILQAVNQVNRRQREWVIRKVTSVVPTPCTIAVLGLAFKAGTDDMRDAPALTILPALLKLGYSIRAYDPVAMEMAKGFLGHDITYCEGVTATLIGSDVALILTEWDEFVTYSMADIKQHLTQPMVIDCRNILNRQLASDLGLTIIGIGRGI